MRNLVLYSVIIIFLAFTLNAKVLVRSDGSYETAKLEGMAILKVIQNDVGNFDSIESIPETLEKNLKHMVDMGKRACAEEDKPNILVYHEFPLTGYFSGNREVKLKASITVPGKETDALAKLAKECGTYIIFGAYAKDNDWPGHVLSINTVIDREGKIVARVWKVKNIKRFYDTSEIYTTTIESVRDKFRQKYSLDDEFPVLKTEFGNIAVTTVQLDPFVMAAFAMKGAEIIIRTATMFFKEDVIQTARVNNVYSVMANIPGPAPYGGGSMVVNHLGDVMGMLDHENEGILTAKLPIFFFRKGRKIPQYSTEMTKEIFSQYVQEIPLNHLDLPEDKLPKDGKTMKTLLDGISRWLNIY